MPIAYTYFIKNTASGNSDSLKFLMLLLSNKQGTAISFNDESSVFCSIPLPVVMYSQCFQYAFIMIDANIKHTFLIDINDFSLMSLKECTAFILNQSNKRKNQIVTFFTYD